MTVLGSNVADRRVEAVREATRFWNETFRRLGLRPPFSGITWIRQAVPEALLASYSRSVLRRLERPSEPNPLSETPGDLVIVLSDSAIISFAAPLGNGGRSLVGVRTDRVPPLSLPNVPRNLVAHELGHVLGLGHHDDPTKLMCGRPAPCRPDAFTSDEPRFFEITLAERDRLRRIHGRGGG